MYVYGHQDQSHNPCILTLCIHQEYVSWLEVQNNKIIPTLNTNCIELVCYIFFFFTKVGPNYHFSSTKSLFVKNKLVQQILLVSPYEAHQNMSDFSGKGEPQIT